MIFLALSKDTKVKKNHENQSTDEEKLFSGILWLNAKDT